MATYKLKNWRDQQGSELDRAKRLIQNKPISLAEISKITKIPYQTLKNYSFGTLSLDKATWQHVNKLAQVYDMVKVSQTIPQDDVMDFQGLLHDIFDANREDYPSFSKMFDRMEQIITSDPVAVAELYKAQNK